MRAASAAAVVAVAVASVAAAATVERRDFRYVRTLPDDVAGGRIAFEPDGLLLAHARPRLADVRILDARGRQVPWRLVPQERRAPEPAEVLNSGRRGNAAVALVDVGPRRGVYQRVELEIEGRNFVGRVTVRGADRRTGPFTRLSTTTVYDVEGAARARSTTAVLPPTDYRFLELNATGVRRIVGAAVLGEFERPDVVRRRHGLVGDGNRGRTTVFMLDFGVRGVPVTRLEVRSATPRYDRPVRVVGSNDRAAFTDVGFGRATRAEDIVSPPIELDSRFRYLRVTIENGDDPPLRDVRLETFGPSFALMVEPGHPPPLELLYGSDLAAPSYEFARLPAERPARILDPSQLPPERRNPVFDVEDTRSFVDRHGWVFQAVLAVAAVAIAAAAFLALRRRA